MSTAMSHRSAVLIGEESSWGTAVARSLAISALSSTFDVNENPYISAAMRNDPVESVHQRGLRDVTGSISLEPNPNELGRLLRGTFASRSTAALAGTPASAPTATIAAGGSLTADAVYRYKISAVVEHDDGSIEVLPPSAEDDATPTGTDLSVDLSWSAPAAYPARSAHEGYVIWRTVADGATNTQVFLAYQSGSGTTYTDDGSATPDTAITAASVATIYRHTYSRGTGAFASYSIETLKNNSYSELATGCKFGGLNLAWQSDSPVTCDFEVVAKDLEKVSEGTPSFSLAAHPLMAHRTRVTIADQGGSLAAFTYATQVSLAIANNLDPKRNLNNSRLVRAIKEGRQSVTGSFVRDYEDMDLFDEVISGQAKALHIETFGNPVASWEKTVGGTTLRPWRYRMAVDLPDVRLTTHQAPSSGTDAILQTVSLAMMKDSTAGYPVQIEIHNLTASYS